MGLGLGLNILLQEDLTIRGGTPYTLTLYPIPRESWQPVLGHRQPAAGGPYDQRRYAARELELGLGNVRGRVWVWVRVRI